MQAESVLLEPVYAFSMELPTGQLGRTIRIYRLYSSFLRDDCRTWKFPGTEPVLCHEQGGDPAWRPDGRGLVYRFLYRSGAVNGSDGTVRLYGTGPAQKTIQAAGKHIFLRKEYY